MLRKIKRSFAIRGFAPTIKWYITRLFQYLFYYLFSKKRPRDSGCDRDLEFDRVWGVNTGGTTEPEKSEVVGKSTWIYGSNYQGVAPNILARVLHELSVDFERFTFADFGSGKGRAILVASSFPFKRIIGVEYSAKLNEIARQNLQCYPNSAKRCREIEVVCADATRFPIPDGPLVLFFYNPFGGQAMENAVQNIRLSFLQNPRRIIVIYFSPEFANLWKKADFIQEVKTSQWYRIYDTDDPKKARS
jgi:predicted RNA methylase